MLVCQVCPSASSCLCLPSILIIPFLHWKDPWPRILKGEDALSSHICSHICLKFIPWVGWITCLFLTGFCREVFRILSESLILPQGIILITISKYVFNLLLPSGLGIYRHERKPLPWRVCGIKVIRRKAHFNEVEFFLILDTQCHLTMRTHVSTEGIPLGCNEYSLIHVHRVQLLWK